MFSVHCGALLCLLAVSSTTLPAYAQGDDPFDKYISKEGLYPIPVGHQPDVRPGTLIVLTGDLPTYINPDYKQQPVDATIVLRQRIKTDAKGLNVFFRLVGVDASSVFNNTSKVQFAQTTLKGTHFDDTVRERVMLQPNTPLAAEFQKWQSPEKHLVYFVRSVYGTTELNVSKVSNSELTATFNGTQNGKCTVVTADVIRNTDPPAPAPHGGGPSNREESAVPDATTPSAGIQLCKGVGDTVAMTSKQPVPVAMEVCYVWVGNDGSYNCDKPKKWVKF